MLISFMPGWIVHGAYGMLAVHVWRSALASATTAVSNADSAVDYERLLHTCTASIPYTHECIHSDPLADRGLTASASWLIQHSEGV
jgi:hypothetical protein